MRHLRILIVSVLCALATAGQTYAHTRTSLATFDAALQELASSVSPAVVQVLTSGYGLANARDASQTPVFMRQQGLGSGVILDRDGYIITNAHVVKGAERIQVVLTKPAPPAAAAPRSAEHSIVPAKVVGSTEYFDLALLKVDAKDLPTLPFADFGDIKQGQFVVAVGSPQGLDNSVTMGIISAVSRQADGASPIAYVQTDAPINPGNSGGALVDVNGHLIGINTFIFTEGGGSEGLGFALPAPIVKMAYRDLREKGYVDRRTIGIGAQQITPTMAQGLGLTRLSGLIVCDVIPDGAAATAGVKIGDVIIEADGMSISAPPQLDGTIYSKEIDDPLNLVVLRGNERVPVQIAIETVDQPTDPEIDAADPQKNMFRQLGVIAATVTPDKVDGLRIASGVVVIARTTDPTEAQLSPGDIIHSLNNAPIASIEELRCSLDKLKHGDAVVLQVERQGGLQYVSFELE